MLLTSAERRFKLATRDRAQLAEFRHALRALLRFSEAAAAGLISEHHHATLVVHRCPDDQHAEMSRL